jgi:hypothetical protein
MQQIEKHSLAIFNELGRPPLHDELEPRKRAGAGEKFTAQQAFPLGNSTIGLSPDKHEPGPNGELVRSTDSRGRLGTDEVTVFAESGAQHADLDFQVVLTSASSPIVPIPRAAAVSI